MSEICQFSIDNRSRNFDQLTTIIKIIQRLRNSEIDKTNKKVVIQKDGIQFIERKSKRGQEKIIK